MKQAVYVWTLALLSLSNTAFAQEKSARPFMIVGVCLREEQDFAALTQVVKLIAQSGNDQFIDYSEQTKQQLERTAELTKGSRHQGPVLNIGVQRSDGSGLGAGNLGLPPLQVAVGFSSGENKEEATRFAFGVLERIGAKWKYEILPAEKGVISIHKCATIQNE